MKTRIVVDSTADILPEYLDQIHTVPLTVSFGEEEYIDGVTIDHRTFYQKLIETDAMVLPGTDATCHVMNKERLLLMKKSL